MAITQSHSLYPVTNSFGNKSFMHPMRRLDMHSWWAPFFPLGAGWGGVILVFFSVFPMCSQRVLITFPWAPQSFLSCCPKAFPIAPQFYPIWFAQSSTLMYINWNDWLKGSTLVSILQLGSKELLILRSAQCSQKNWWWWDNQYVARSKQKT
jgi:hypothetical protein